ncbi:MAG: substrate-binding domain-containing protein [Ktedonobacteraceae bacterium]
MTEQPVPLADLSEDQRTQAYTRFTIICPVLEDGVSQSHVARIHNVPVSTVQRWVKRYRENGIAGLADAERSDKGTSRRLPPDAITLVEGLALQAPPRSVASIHRQVTAIAQEQGWNPPSYARVRQIIQNFIPSMAAAGLASGRRQLIGMLIPSFIWSLIPELMRGVADVLEDTSYELVLYSIKNADIERDHSEVINRVLATQLTAGLLAVFPGTASPELTRLYNQGFPVVIVDDQRVQTTPWISVDNLTGAYTVVRHLIKLGHRRIAHIAGPAAYRASHERFEGYRRALLEAGITPDPALTLEGDFMPPSGRACASKLFALPPEERPTAIFAATDQMAYGVISAAEEYGLSIPHDIALVGFDDDSPSMHVYPPLTTVRQPYYEMGEQGLKLLLSLLDTPRDNLSGTTRAVRKAEEEAGTQPARILLPTNLVVRASCGADFQIPVSTTTGNDVI